MRLPTTAQYMQYGSYFVGWYAETRRYVTFLPRGMFFGCLKNSMFVTSIDLLARPFVNLTISLLFTAVQNSVYYLLIR